MEGAPLPWTVAAPTTLPDVRMLKLNIRRYIRSQISLGERELRTLPDVAGCFPYSLRARSL